MGRYLIGRVLQTVLSMLVVISIVFFLTRLSGNPVNLLLDVNATQRDGEGYFASAHHRVTTATRALVTDGLDVDVDDDIPDWMLHDGRIGTLRVTASGTVAKPVFVGIGPTDRIDQYLRGVDRDEVSEFQLDPFSVSKTRHAGTALPAPPVSQRFWSESATGRGEQKVEWPVQKGDWSVVVMNADGSPGVATDVSVGAKLGLILWVGVGLVAFGALLLAAGVVAIVTGRRRPSRAEQSAAGEVVEAVA